MFLVITLLISVAVLSLASGVALFVGAHKDDRQRALVLLVVSVCAFAWILGITFFLTATSLTLAWTALVAVFSAFPLMLAVLFAFAAWPTKTKSPTKTLAKPSVKSPTKPLAKATTSPSEKLSASSPETALDAKSLALPAFTALAALALVFALNSDHTLLFGPIALSENGNQFTLINTWFFWTYLLFCILTISATTTFTLRSAHSARRKALRLGHRLSAIAFALAGAVAVLTSLVLPLFAVRNLLWLAPLALGLALLVFLFVVLRYRLLAVSPRALLLLSIATLVIVGVNLYMCIFTFALTHLFKITTLGAEVLALNFIMILITLLLLPILNEAYAYLRSLVKTSEVNIAYITKKLNRLATTDPDLSELARFLADHLHFSYVGLSVRSRLFASETLPISSAELTQLSKLDPKPRSIWLAPDEEAEELYDRLNLSAVAELHNGKGKTFGLILVGKPLGKTKIDRRDLIQVEMIINLVATIVDSERHPKAS